MTHPLPPLLAGLTQGEMPVLKNIEDPNRQARLKIVNALGGILVAAKIPQVVYPAIEATSAMDELGGEGKPSPILFPENCPIVQTEDPAGRIALLLKMSVIRKIKPTELEEKIAVVYQKHRETYVSKTGEDGANWGTRGLDLWQCATVTDIAEALNSLARGTHPYYSLKGWQDKHRL